MHEKISAIKEEGNMIQNNKSKLNINRKINTKTESKRVYRIDFIRRMIM